MVFLSLPTTSRSIELQMHGRNHLDVEDDQGLVDHRSSSSNRELEILVGSITLHYLYSASILNDQILSFSLVGS